MRVNGSSTSTGNLGAIEQTAPTEPCQPTVHFLRAVHLQPLVRTPYTVHRPAHFRWGHCRARTRVADPCVKGRGVRQKTKICTPARWIWWDHRDLSMNWRGSREYLEICPQCMIEYLRLPLGSVQVKVLSKTLPLILF